MNRVILGFAVLVLCSAAFSAGTPVSSNDSKQAGEAQPLEKVLDSMDAAAEKFRSAEMNFDADQYESAVNVHTPQNGVMYIRKTGSSIEMAADIKNPNQYVLFTHNKVQLYQPAIDQLTVYDAGKNQEAVQSFLVLGFGKRGHDLSQQFEVKYAGSEKIGAIETGKLELVPKSPRVRGMFERIVLWIDLARGISVQQQFFEPASGNYRLVKYSGIRLNVKIRDDVFRLKTTSRTKVVTP